MDNINSRIQSKATDRFLCCDTDSVLACGAGIDNFNHPIRTDANSVLATLPSASVQSQIGRLFSATFGEFLTPESRSRLLIIENPTDSGRIIYLDSVLGGITAIPGNQPLSYQTSLSFTLTRDNAIQGSPFEERNLNFGFPDNSGMNLFFSNGVHSGTIVAQSLQVFGQFSLDFRGKIIIPPGHNLGIQTFAGSLSEGNVNMRETVIWYELDLPAKPK
ncbi:MAG: hypothetical protein ACM3YE_10970 [Bacteroidota bacterium]